MIEIATVGGIIIDSVIAADGTVSLEQMGGNCVYAAVGARTWGKRVGIAGWVPRNYPMNWLARAHEAGIATDGAAVGEENVDLCEWFIYRDDGSRADQLLAPPGAFTVAGHGAKVTRDQADAWQAHLRQRSYAGRGFGEFRRAHPKLAWPEAYTGARAVHLSQGPIALADLLDQMPQGTRISVDPARATATLPRAALAPIMARIDAFLPSEKELKFMFPDLSVEAALPRLAEIGPRVVAVKRGAAGSIIWDRRAAKAVAVPAIKTAARDPTGAGDAWCGGFVAGMLDQDDPVIAACHATVSGSFAIEGFGALHGLSADPKEARRRLAELRRRMGADT